MSLFLIFMSGFSYAEKPLFESGEHCVAYRAYVKLAVLMETEAVGKNCSVNTQFLPDIGDVYYFKAFIPISSFDSQEQERDRDVAKLLQVEAQPELVYTSEKLNLKEWKERISKKKFQLNGQINIAGKNYPTTSQVEFIHKKPNTYEVYGVSQHKFANFNIDPPSLAGGIAAKVQDRLELHFRFNNKETMGTEYLFE